MTTLNPDAQSDGAPPVAASPVLNRWQIRTVLVVLLTGQLLSALDQSIVGIALPTVATSLGGLDQLSLLVVPYLLTSTVSTLVYGKLADLYGAKPVYLGSIGLFTLGSLLVGVSQDMTQIVTARAVQGIGAGGLVILAFTIGGSVIPPRQLGRLQGLVGAMYALASLVGPVLGGVFIDQASWRWCFLVNVPVGLVALVAVQTQLRLPKTPRRPATVDVWGALLVVAASTCLLFVLLTGGDHYTWGSPVVLGLGAGGVLLTGLLTLWERRAPDPLVPLRLIMRPDIGVALVITFISGVAMFGAFVFLPVYLQVVRAEEPTAAGLHLLPLMMAIMVGSGASGWLISAVLGRTKTVVVLGNAIMLASLLLFARLDADTPTWELWTYEIVMGVGMGMVVSKLIILVQNNAGPESVGTITAQAAFFRILGASIGTALLAAVLNGQTGHRGGVYADPAAAADFADGLQVVFLTAAPIMAVALLLSFLLPDSRLRDEHAEAGQEAAPA